MQRGTVSASIDGHDLGRRDTGPPTEHVHERARRRVRHVVVSTRRMVDRVAAAASSAALKIAQLGQQTRVVKQFDLAAIERRQQPLIEVTLRGLTHLVRHAEFPKHFPRPFTGVPVASDPRHPIRPQQVDELGHDLFG